MELPGTKTLRIAISDNGGGIPENNLKNLFKPFFTTKSGGTGLGLVICRQIVEMHNGTIVFESEANKGTTVRITLPLRTINSRTAKDAAAKQPPGLQAESVLPQ